MPDEIFPFVYAGGATLTGALSAYAWRRRDASASGKLAGLLASVTGWLLASLASELAGSEAATMRWGAIAFVGLGCTIAFLTLFALRYAGYDDVLVGRRAFVLFVHPAVIGLVALTNAGTGVTVAGFGGHELFYEPASSASAGSIDWRAGFWVHTVYSYGLVAASTVLVGRTALESNDAYRGQSATVLAAILVPWVANVLDLLVPGVDGLLVIGFCVAGLLLTLSIYRYDLTDLSPVARPVVVEAIADGVVVVDGRGRVVDANERAADLLAPDREVLPLGEPAADVLPDPVEAVRSGETDRDRVDLDGHVLDVETTPFPTGEPGDRGTVLVLHDVTEEHAYRTELERQTERLDRFASVVSHDLRNPLSVAQGYTDLAAETGDLDHLEQVRDAHGRMETLVEDALLLAREGETSTDPEPVALADLAERAWQTVDTGDASLSVDTDAVVRADPVRSVQLFENCYRNAVEAGATHVTVGPIGAEEGADRDQQGSGFYVADDGPGIPPDVTDDLFETGVSGGEGTGLGLAIVSRIADGHGWAVEATESGAGGARFEFRGVEFPDRAAAEVRASG